MELDNEGLFRAYFYWIGRNGTTHKDFTSYKEAEKAIQKKFENKRCALAKIENINTCESSDFYKNEI